MGRVTSGLLRTGALLGGLVVWTALLAPGALAQDASPSDSESPSESASGSESESETAAAGAAATGLSALSVTGLCRLDDRAVWEVTNPNTEAVAITFDDDSAQPLGITAEPGDTVFEANAVATLTITYGDTDETASAPLATDECEYDLSLGQVWQDAAGQPVAAPADTGTARLTIGDETIEPGESVVAAATASNYNVQADPPSGWRLLNTSSEARQGAGRFDLTLTDAAAPIAHELVYRATESAASEDDSSTTAAADDDDGGIIVPSRVDTGGGGAAPTGNSGGIALTIGVSLAAGGAWLVHQRAHRS